jgi:predicted ATPase
VFESGKQASLDSFEVLKEAVIAIYNTLVSIFILDPAPIKMRSYSSVSHQLADDAANIAGVLAALSDEKKSSVESTLSNYIVHLPEQDMRKVWAETVGRLNTDAMLYCEESWASDKPPMVIDARGMSDGTLRFLAIVTAILTRPEGSQLVIEEVDNGLHPSRAELLLKMLKELGAKRKIDILVTTHNPALLNALEPEMIPFVVVAHRDAQTGESKLTPLDDIQRLPKLLASGHIGDLATQGAIEKSLSQ